MIYSFFQKLSVEEKVIIPKASERASIPGVISLKFTHSTDHTVTSDVVPCFFGAEFSLIKFNGNMQ